jgi:hypothetical protein
MLSLDISDHCYRCRQDSLCKRLLVQRAREMLRSTSTSPISSEGTLSSDEEDEILNTHVDVIAALGKGFELKTGITVADMDAIADDEDAITCPPPWNLWPKLSDHEPMINIYQSPHSLTPTRLYHPFTSHTPIHRITLCTVTEPHKLGAEAC